MNKSPLSRTSLSSRKLIVKPSVEEEATRAAFLTLPQLVVDRSNLAATTKALADRFAIAGGGLKSKATWQIEIPFGHPELGKTALASHDARSNFIDRVKQEIAEFTGVDVGKVVLEIRIVA